MDFQLNDEQKMIQEMARDVGQKEIAPYAEAMDSKGEFPARQIKKLAELGLMGMMIPTEWDGSGLDTVTYAVALEEICAVLRHRGTNKRRGGGNADQKRSEHVHFLSSQMAFHYRYPPSGITPLCLRHRLFRRYP